MIKIGCYQAKSDFLVKSFCKLAEKSYYSFGKSYVITGQEVPIDALDRALWTYSKKHFIPHAKIDDPMPEKQPILLSEELSMPNKLVENIILINLPAKHILKVITSLPQQNNLSKISVIYDENIKVSRDELTQLFQKSNLNVNNLSFFQQLALDKWQTIT
ncbi:MAG: hypothetical protein DGJ47_000761 [Rickettsiaceae bacterium]